MLGRGGSGAGLMSGSFVDVDMDTVRLKNYLEDYCSKRNISPESLVLYESLKNEPDFGNIPVEDRKYLKSPAGKSFFTTKISDRI